MNGSQNVPIRRVLWGTNTVPRPLTPRNYPTSTSVESLLARPTWSVRSLLPPSKRSSESANPSLSLPSPPTDNDTQEITRSKLHHLLNLSALPLPSSEKEESRMLQTLRDQIHFVKAIQSVDTDGVEPLITIRDETDEAIEEETVTLAKMMPYLELEEKVGTNGTVRRRDVVRTPEEDAAERKSWEVDVGDLGWGSERRRKGRFFFVKRAKKAVEGKVARDGGSDGNGALS